MRVLSIAWLGISTTKENYLPLVSFLHDTMNMKIEFEEPSTTELSLESHGRVQVFGPGTHYHQFFARNATGPIVALFGSRRH